MMLLKSGECCFVTIMLGMNPITAASHPNPAKGGPPGILPAAYTASADAVIGHFQVSVAAGLGAVEVRRRRGYFGPNSLRESRPQSAFHILLDQFKSLIVALLGSAVVLSSFFGHWVEAGAIAAVIAINAAIGFFTELRAIRSMEALRRLSVITANVRRDGETKAIHARDLVPGDIVVIEGGDVVSADLRLVEASKLQCDELVLTGESLPVVKHTDPLAEDTALPERSNMLFQGTAVTRGSGVGIVVATGMATELGQIASLAEEAEAAETPLEKRIAQLSRQLVWATLGLTVLIGAAGIATGKPAFLMLQTAIALAVAAVPEGLPMVATLALARGMWRMARRNALIERLSAVETLGATTVILTDKTGTLTENRMTVVELMLPCGDVSVASSSAAGPVFASNGAALDPLGQATLRPLLEVCVLCNNAALSRDSGSGDVTRAVGDPTETALLLLGAKDGLYREDLLGKYPELHEELFDPDLKMMATIHQAGDQSYFAVKGAPEALLARATHVLQGTQQETLSAEERTRWRNGSEALARRGLRVLAVASKSAASADEPAYQGLTLLGLVGLQDPPRADVAAAIAACKRAGIRVVMVTGDHAVTAQQIATAVGLDDGTGRAVVEGKVLTAPAALSKAERLDLLQTSVFARVSPRQKLDLISLYQDAGAVVAMTGDGVNDAPALRKADIGIAMGRRGSQVAREASDMVLQDDAFGTIVAAIAQGRIIFANIRKFIVYLLSCNLSEIMIVGLASLGGLPLPILPLQILYLNLVTDVFPAFALGASEGEADIMGCWPRDPKEPLLPRRQWIAIVAYGATITAATLTAFGLAILGLGLEADRAVTIAFLTLALAQLWHVFNMRDAGTALLVNEVTRNPYVWAALGLCLGLILSAVYLPGLSAILGLSPPTAAGWGLAAAFSLVPCVLGQIAKAVSSRDISDSGQVAGSP